MTRAAALALFAALFAAAPAGSEPLTVTTRLIESFAPSGMPEGPLTFLGGLSVASPDDRFGGLSGIAMINGRTALMVSDTGWAVSAELKHESGRLSGLAEAEIHPVFPGGRAPKALADLEDIALDPADPNRGVIVRERQPNAMLTFEREGRRLSALAPKRVGADNRILRTNHALESVAYAPATSPLAGEIITIAERPPRGMADIPAWIADVDRFSIVRRDDFAISSARFLPDGDLVLLERRFRALSGVAIRLRRIPGEAVVPGARLDGDILLSAGMASQIDNLEGLAVHTDAQGRVILTLVSDDNFNPLQRTLILQFALADA